MNVRGRVSGGASASFVHERHGAGTSHVLGVHPLNAEPRLLEESIDGAIQVAATGERLPERCEPVLPLRDADVTRSAMLDEEQPARSPQDTPHLLKCTHDIRDRTERPRDNHRINTLTAQRDVFA